MSTSLAAGVAILASITWFTFAPQRATAAETLQKAAAATQAYQGWVHIRYRSDATTTQPAGAIESDMYIDTATGTTINDYTIDGRRQIEMWDVTNKRELTYDGAKNQIVIGDTSPSFAKEWATQTMNYPITLAETIKQFKQVGDGKAEPKIEQFDENGMKRLEISLPAAPTLPSSASPGPATAPSRGSTTAQAEIVRPLHVTMWIDPKTDLIQKVKSTGEDEPSVVEYLYGEKIKGLYDLHVPRDAKVVDNRTKGDVNALFARLQKRYEKGFGDFVALESEMDVDHPEKPDREGAVKVHAVHGDKWFYQRFLVGRKEYGPGQPRDVAVEPFDTWPPKDCKTVLDRLHDALPSDFLVSDGKTAWQGGGASRRDYTSRALEGKMVQSIPMMRARMTFPGFVWPARTRIGLFGADAKASLITDEKKHPGAIGLHIEQQLFVTDMSHKQLDVSDYWLDPARDDVPIEWSNVTYEKDGKTIANSSVTTFDDWKQLPDGTWYPTRWTSSFVMNGQGRSVNSKQAFQLVMCPGMQIGDEWFTDPGKKK